MDFSDKNTISAVGEYVKEKIPTVPEKVSAFENDAGYLTGHQSLEGYAKKTDIPTKLPANGGNADTVGGLSPTSFLYSEATVALNTDINECFTPGTYAVSTVYTPNMPTGAGDWGILDVRKYGSTVTQKIEFTDTNLILNRHKIINQQAWSEWKPTGTNAFVTGSFSCTKDTPININIGFKPSWISVMPDNGTEWVRTDTGFTFYPVITRKIEYIAFK